MKRGRRARSLVAAFFVFVLLMFTNQSALALQDLAELPTVAQWYNGAAMNGEGAGLHDTWAIDDTGASKAQYVLINQEGVETLRVQKYPDDVSNGNAFTVPQYSATVSLSVPAGFNKTVMVTVEKEGVLYTLSFQEAESNSYTVSRTFYPGEYSVTAVEVLGDTTNALELVDVKTLNITGNNQQTLWKTKVGTGASSPTNSNSPSSDHPEDATQEAADKTEADGVDIGGTFSGFDSDGDLLWDTIKLVIATIVLFAVYGIIKVRRKRKEELHK